MADTLGRSLLPAVLRSFVSLSSANQAGPAIASMLIYVMMAVILALRPQGSSPSSMDSPDITVPAAAVEAAAPAGAARAAPKEPWLTPRGVVGTIILVLLALIPLYSQLAHQPFYLALFWHVVIYAIAAVALNLLVGYCGLVSFGDALYFGLGAYSPRPAQSLARPPVSQRRLARFTQDGCAAHACCLRSSALASANIALGRVKRLLAFCKYPAKMC